MGRDLILPLGFVGLIVVGLAIRHLVGSDRPEGQLMVAFLVVGGVLSSVGDLLFLSDVTYWRSGGWSGHPPEIMESIGRAASAIETLNVWPEVAGFPILAAGLLYVGRLCRTRPELPTQLGIVAYVEAALLLVIAIAEAVGNDTANQVLSLITGVLVAPVLGVWLGRHFGRLAKR
ncbi:MAG TPA: hypothetical protein VGL16_13475 [Actinomycetota bacterium]